MMISQKALDASQDLFSQLDAHWTGDAEDQGMDRPAWSCQETAATRILYGFAQEELNMQVWEDLVGNIYMMPKGAEDSHARVRMTGSHVDAVSHGGRFDGPAGVIAPLTALYQAKLNGEAVHPNTVITIWRNEESPWLNQFAVGSKFATGVLSEEFLTTSKHTKFGSSLFTLLNQDFDGNGVKLLEKLRSDDPKLLDPNLIEGLVETHIEQSYALEEADKSLGFVTTIRGNVRFPDMIDFYGETGHSGTVPQKDRLDTNLIKADYILRTNAAFKALEAAGHDIVWSYPQDETVNGGSSKIPGHSQLRPEVRSTSPYVLKHAAMIFQGIAEQIQNETGIRIELNRMNTQQPVEMSGDIRRELNGIAMNRGLTNAVMDMPSGAGHDVQVLAEAGVAGGLIFIRHGNRGASHRPDEILGRTPNDNPFTVGSDFAHAVAMNYGWMMGQTTSYNPYNTSFLRDLEQRGARKITAPR